MEARLFPEGTVPEHCTAQWYAQRDTAPHVDEPVHRPRIDMAHTFVLEALVGTPRLYTVVDLGAGDGGMLSLFHPSLDAWGYDLQPTNVAKAAERGVRVELANVLEDDIQWGDIAVCTEMLEHLVDPHAFVHKIWQNAQALVASSPWTETAESYYPFHTWAWDQEGYAAMIEAAGWRIVKHQTTGMFQVVLAVAS